MDAAGNFVPKVHPLARDAEPEDPMELMGDSAPGDPEVMLECLVQEFAGMGWGARQLLELFRDPNYPVLNQLRDAFGEDEIRRRLGDLLDSVGVFRVRESIVEDAEPLEPELIQLSVRRD